MNSLEYINGPSSYYKYDTKFKKLGTSKEFKIEIHFFGDYHFQITNDCPHLYNVVCSSKNNQFESKCENLELLLINMMNHAQKTNKNFEFYLETGFDTTNVDRPTYQFGLYMFDLYRVFNTFLKRNKPKIKNIKLHYIDNRISSDFKNNIEIFWALHSLFEEIKRPENIPLIVQNSVFRFWNFIIDKILPFIPDFYFRNDYPSEVLKINRLIVEEVNDFKLKVSTNDRLYNLIETRFTSDINSLLSTKKTRNQNNYSLTKSQLVKLDAGQAQAIENYFKKVMEEKKNLFQKTIFHPVLITEISALQMDCYFVARMINSIHQTDKDMTIAVYTGNAHTLNYIDFLKDILKLDPKISIPADYASNGEVKRCLYNPDFRSIFPYAESKPSRDPLIIYSYLKLDDPTKVDLFQKINNLLSENYCFGPSRVNILDQLNFNDIVSSLSFAVVLYKEDNTIIGTATCYFHRKLNQYVIYNVCIIPNARRMGYTQEMIKYIQEITAPYPIQLFVNPASADVKKASKAYITTGFKNPKYLTKFPRYSDMNDKSVVIDLRYIGIGLIYLPNEQNDPSQINETISKINKMIDYLVNPPPIQVDVLYNYYYFNIEPFIPFDQLSILYNDNYSIFNPNIQSFKKLNELSENQIFLKLYFNNMNQVSIQDYNQKIDVNNFNFNSFFSKIASANTNDIIVFSISLFYNNYLHNDYFIIYQNYFPKILIHFTTSYSDNDYITIVQSKINPNLFDYQSVSVKPFLINYNTNYQENFVINYFCIANQLMVGFFLTNIDQTIQNILNFINRMDYKNDFKIALQKYVANLLTK